MRINLTFINLLFPIVLGWKFHFTATQTGLLTFIFSLMLQILNQSSNAARCQTLINNKRPIVEAIILYIDEVNDVSYGLIFITSLRFIDLIFFGIKMYPEIKKLVPLVTPLINQLLIGKPPVDLNVKRKPIFDD